MQKNILSMLILMQLNGKIFIDLKVIVKRAPQSLNNHHLPNILAISRKLH